MGDPDRPAATGMGQRASDGFHFSRRCRRGCCSAGFFAMRTDTRQILFAALALALVGVASAQEALVRRGREVYIAEGCIHCHSQYVRPDTDDGVWWGPVRPLQELERQHPPLFRKPEAGA